jgi:hypothetical protein
MKKRYQDTDLIAIAIDISLKAAFASLMVFSLLLLLTGCVSGNKAELSAVKIEKQSTAQEVDQYVNTAGRVADWLFRRGE